MSWTQEFKGAAFLFTKKDESTELHPLQNFQYRFRNGQFVIALNEDHARFLTGNKTEVFSCNPLN